MEMLTAFLIALFAVGGSYAVIYLVLTRALENNRQHSLHTIHVYDDIWRHSLDERRGWVKKVNELVAWNATLTKQLSEASALKLNFQAMKNDMLAQVHRASMDVILNHDRLNGNGKPPPVAPGMDEDPNGGTRRITKEEFAGVSEALRK